MSGVTARLAAVERAARERRAVLEAPAKVLAAEERRRSESAALIAWVEARAEAAAAAPALSPAELADLAAGWTAAAERADGEHRRRLCERIANMARARAIELEAMERGEWPTEGVAAWENGANLIERAALGPRRLNQPTAPGGIASGLAAPHGCGHALEGCELEAVRFGAGREIGGQGFGGRWE